MMEVNLLMGSSDIIKEPILVSNSIHSSSNSKPGKLVLMEQEANKCKHFTIRGFVSEVRKRNAKICWPFSMHDHTSDGHVHTLPPLPVKEFRRWGCRSCVPKTIAPEAITENRTNMTNTNDGDKKGSTLPLGDDTKASHCETIKLLYKSQLQSEENYRDEVEVQHDSSVRVSNCKQQSLLHCGEKRDKSQAADLIKGDISVTKGGYNRSKENQNLMSKPNAIAAEQEACQMVKREGDSRADNSDISPLADDTPRILLCEHDTATLVHRTGGSGTSEGMVAPLRFTSASSDKELDQGLRKLGKRKEPEDHVDKAHRMAMGVDTDGAIPSPSVPLTPHDSKGLDECGNEMSETSVHFVVDMLHSHDAAQKPGILVEKSRARKSRKMRTLNEIIHSEGLKIDVKKFISSESAGASGSASVETLDASRQKVEHPNLGCHLVQNTEAAEIDRKNRKKAAPSDGEGTLLIDLLKTVPKKANLHKGEADSKRINNVASASKFATMKGLDLNLEYSRPGEFKQGLIAENKRNMIEVVKPSTIPQEDSTVQKGHITREVLLNKNSRGKRSGIFIFDKELETCDNIHKKLSSNNKNKRPLVEDGTSSQRCFKEQSVPQGHREGKKKQRIVPMSEPEAVDDFAMEIVKVLSNMKAENKANMSKLSETTVGIKDDNGQSGKSGNHGCKVLDTGPANRCLSREEPQYSNTGNDASSPLINNGDDICRSRASLSSGGSKPCHQFDLNKEPSACASEDLQEPSPFVGLSVSGPQLSIVDSNRNYSPRNLSKEGVKMAAFSSNTLDQTVAADNVFKISIDGSHGLLNGYPPRINKQMVCSGLNSDSIYPGVNRQAVAPNADYQTSTKLSKDNSESSIFYEPFAAKSFAEPGNDYCSDLMRPVNVPNNATVSGNGYHTNMMQPVNIPNNNGTDSAVNLLGLLQHSTGSAEPSHSSFYNAYMGYIQAIHCLGWDFLRSLVADPKMLSGSSSNCKLDMQPGDLCRPLRPLPRKNLDPLLQMEFDKTTKDVAPTRGFGTRNPGMLTFQNTGFITGESNALTSDKGKAKACRLARVTNVQPSTSLYGAFEKVGSSLVSRATAGRCLPSEGIGQVVTGSRDRTFQPLRSTSKMEKCLLNRNPADFVVPDEDSEYMIGYEKRNTNDLLQTGTLLPQTHLHGKKEQKIRRLNGLNRSRTSNKPSLSRFSPQNTK